MINRRQFIKNSTYTAGAVATYPIKVTASRHQTSAEFFGVHEFIENNPEAVFIMKTDVDSKTNDEAKKQTGLEFGRSVIVPKENGIPVTSLIPIKPNLTNINRSGSPKDNIEYRMGIVTDPIFVEGMIESLKELGISGDQISMIETWNLGNWDPIGFTGVAERTGTHMNDTGETKVANLSKDKIQWIDVPEGVWFRKIPYIWPINAQDTWLLNISKFKTHGMGVTLCCKNIQGTICHDYQEHCSRYDSSMNISADHMNPNAKEDIWENYQRRLAEGVPRWDKPGSNGGIWMETWGSRCLDNNSVTQAGLHIVEGIYGRDGDGFLNGPNKGDLKDNEAWDYMTNIIIFGKNQYNVDIIGHWLAGHEPGNFGLFHMAIDRGYTSKLNPFDIPVYEWIDGQATLTPLDEFNRTTLQTYYLQRNYDGQDEPYFHLCDEPYDYPALTGVDSQESALPKTCVLHQNSPNPFNPNTSIEYTIPGNGQVRIEVFNMSGQLVDVLTDSYKVNGTHMAVWNTNSHAAGLYMYRLRFRDFTETKKMMLLK
ncbi:MAG: DUF362 domain-containing protein [Candidatus Latescibacteria bacterium]|nr:DUF362 domain-containing protein [Candidatus Latescibacterota bacterium]